MMMDTQNTTIIIIQPPPPFPAPPRSIDLSPLKFILALMAIIAIPALVYAFFFVVPFPPYCFGRRHRRSDDFFGEEDLPTTNDHTNTNTQLVSGLKYQKEAHVKDIGSECPVCLSVFSDGEEVRQLSECKHSFHASCIDMWLNSHSNCPICRASVAVKRPNHRSTESARDDDLQQGLPDATTLV